MKPYTDAELEAMLADLESDRVERKPMFDLTSADGAIGAHQTNVQQCRADFEALCREIARRVGCEK